VTSLPETEPSGADTAPSDRASTRPVAGIPLRPEQRERRERIVHAALELLEEREYDKIQMRDVAQRAPVALGTLYHYFSSKEHLYAAVMLEWAASFRATIGRKPLVAASSPERLKELFGRVIRAFERQPQFLRVEIVLESTTDLRARELYEQCSNQHRTTFSASLPSVPVRDARRVTGTVAIVLGSLLHAWAADRVSIETVYETVFSTIDLIYSPPPPDASAVDPGPVEK
jgi:TetR/AcrR family transcriptional regulator, cholesterol catabolism regulator